MATTTINSIPKLINPIVPPNGQAVGSAPILVGSGLDRFDANHDFVPFPTDFKILPMGKAVASATIIRGDYQNNTLYSTSDDDIIDGGGGFDWASYSKSSRGVTVDLSKTGPQNTGMGRDTLINVEGLVGSNYNDLLIGDSNSNDLYGGNGNDTLIGGTGNDLLFGGRGNDVLIGGAGTDYMRGGPGADTFRFDSPSDTPVFTFVPRDKIFDFNAYAGDKIDLSRIDANSNVPDNQAFRFIGQGVPGIGEVGFMRSNDGIILMGQTVLSSVRNIQIDLPGISSISQSSIIL